MEEERSYTPVPAARSARETWDMLRERGRMNRGVRARDLCPDYRVDESSFPLPSQKDLAVESDQLDLQMGFDGATFGPRVVDDDFQMAELAEEPEFSISRTVRTSSSFVSTSADSGVS